MNTAEYREILGENLFPSAHSLRLERPFIFQFNNDPKYTAKTMLEWLWDKSLRVLEWLIQGPDLNPVEHLRRDLKMAVHRSFPSNLMELQRIC